uniref:Ovule protein n=1 Tax=Haemonchus placei TaxID=6290 RepID=A0A0N4WJ33_HAEPC
LYLLNSVDEHPLLVSFYTSFLSKATKLNNAPQSPQYIPHRSSAVQSESVQSRQCDKLFV